MRKRILNIGIIATSLFVPFLSFSADRLSFDNALDQIIGRDDSVDIANKNISASNAKVLSKIANFGPKIDIGITKKYYLLNDGGNSRGLSLSSNWNLFKSGQDISSLNAASHERKYSLLEKDNVRFAIEKSAVKVLLDYIEKYKRFDVMNRLYNVKRESLITIKKRYARGLVSSQEILKGKVDLNNTQARLNYSKMTLRTSKAYLIAKLGHDDIDYHWPWLKMLHNEMYNRVLEQKIVVSDSIDYKLLSERVAVMDNYLDESKRSFLPRIDFSLAVNRNLDYDRTVNKSATFSISLPIWDGFSRYSTYKSSVSSLYKAKYELLKKNREVKSSIKSIEDNLRIAAINASNRKETLNLSRKLYKDNFERFEKGRISVNDLSIEQNRLLDSESLYNQGMKDFHISLLDYCHAKGLLLRKCF